MHSDVDRVSLKEIQFSVNSDLKKIGGQDKTWFGVCLMRLFRDIEKLPWQVA
jgi:hypothetical protein